MQEAQKLRLKIKSTAAQLDVKRTEASHLEVELQGLVGQLVATHDGGLRDWARSIKISAQYACDIRHGRRKISQSVLERLLV